MFKSLKGSNGSFVGVGNLQIQPETNDPVGDQTSQLTNQSHRSMGSLPPHQMALQSPVVNVTNGEASTENMSLEAIVSNLGSNVDFIVPAYHGGTNQMVPSFGLDLEPATTGKQKDENFVMTTKEYEPYEQLTGISQERPEIVMMTNFLPLYVKDVSQAVPEIVQQIENAGLQSFMTDAGAYVDLQLQARNLQVTNIKKVLKSAKAASPIFKQTTDRRKTQFERNVEALTVTSNFLLELVRTIDKIKSQLDLRNGVHTVDTQEVIQSHAMNYTQMGAYSTANTLSDIAYRYLPAKYTFGESLISFGFKPGSVKNRFSSSKIWIQMLVELKDLLLHHSQEFVDIEPISQRQDDNAITISRTNVKHFSVRQETQPVPRVFEVGRTEVSKIPITVMSLTNVWKNMYSSVHFKTPEAQIGALLNLVSKEFRYSYGLSIPNVVQQLNDQFNFTVVQGDNLNVFDSVIGLAGNNVTEFPSLQSNSLINVSQRQPGNDIAVLTFEPKYIDGDSGTITPGGTYYVDSVLDADGKRFNTTKIDSLTLAIEKTHKGFSIVTNGMNFLSAKIYNPYDSTKTKFAHLLASPTDLLGEVTRYLINEQTGETLAAALNDNLGAVFARAATEPRLKSALFMYVLSRITSPVASDLFNEFSTTPEQDNSPTSDAIARLIVDTLENSVPQASTADGNKLTSKSSQTQAKYPTITKETIVASIKATTPIARYVIATMAKMMTAFRDEQRAMVDNRTRFSGHLDTTVMMVVFDAVVNLIARYVNQSIVSKNSGQNQYEQGNVTFNISRTTINHLTSFHDLKVRLEKEVALTHQTVYAALNTLQKTSSSMRKFSNYLKSKSAIERLTDVSEVLANPALLKMLMSEQQIYMLSSTVQDLSDQVKRPNSVPTNQDLDGDNDIDADDELKILDNSVVSPKLRDAMFGALSSSEFTSYKGYNKKILSVGIPQGFSDKLRQQFNITSLSNSSYSNKQSDLVNLVVYKVDLRNSDIVYKPVKFLFELSRFPVRNDSMFLPLSDNPTIEEITSAIPTRDYGEKFGQNTQPTYWPDSPDNKLAFDESYDFLTTKEKDEVIKNHVMSYLYEVYVKMLTGLSLADHEFDLVDPPRAIGPEFIKDIIDNMVSNMTEQFIVSNVSLTTDEPTGGVMFSTTSNNRKTSPNAFSSSSSSTSKKLISTKTAQSQRASLSANRGVSSVSHRNTSVMLQGLRAVSSLANMQTSLADTLAVSRKVLAPKQFDRVFNVMIDPDDFEIDYEKTVRTPHGKQALEQMISIGDVVMADENDVASSYVVGRRSSTGLSTEPIGRSFVQGRLSPNVLNFKLRNRDKTQGDIALEKYFVAIETIGEEE